MEGKRRAPLLVRRQSEASALYPETKCTTFSSSPLKWLRFLGYAIYGRPTSMNEPL